MADITKCLNTKCLSKEICYLQTAPSNKYAQSYAMFEATSKDDCEYFIEDVKDND